MEPLQSNLTPKLPPIGIREVLRIGAPLMLSQAAETVMMFTDRLFLARLGKEHLAAGMMGGLTVFLCTAFMVGLSGYVEVLSAQYHGAGRPRRSVESAISGIWLALAWYPVLLLLQIPLLAVFANSGHDPLQIQLESDYFQTLLIGAPLYLLRIPVSAYLSGLGRTRTVMVANLVGMTINIPLNWLFIFGGLGIPAMGIRGAALGTLGGGLCILAILLVSFLRSPNYQAAKGPGLWKPQKDLLGRLVRFGVPSGMDLFLNILSFNVFLQVVHRFGAETAAAVTVAFNFDLLSFIPLTGLGGAASVLTGQRMGAGLPKEARRAAMLCVRLALGYAALMGTIFLSATPALVGMFIPYTPENASVTALAELLLRLACIYLLADALGVVLRGALRAAGDTRWVMLVGTGMSYTMSIGTIVGSFFLGAGPLAIWVWFIVFVVALGLVMTARFLGGRWQSMRVIEHEEPLLDPAVSSDPARPLDGREF